MSEFTRIEIPNGDLNVALDGPEQAPVILFSNSLGTTLAMWNDQVEYLANDFRIIRYDTRGHGKSSTPHGPYSMDDLGNDAIAILDTLGISKASFCGLSIGGVTAQWMGIYASERLDHLVICNSAAPIGTRSAWLDRAQNVRKEGLGSIAQSTPSRWFTEEFAHSHPALMDTAIGWVANTSIEGYAGCCEALANTDLHHSLSTISVPTLIIAGSKDPVTTVADAEEMSRQIPSSLVVEVPASHLSNLEAPDAFNQALASVLRRK